MRFRNFKWTSNCPQREVSCRSKLLNFSTKIEASLWNVVLITNALSLRCSQQAKEAPCAKKKMNSLLRQGWTWELRGLLPFIPKNWIFLPCPDHTKQSTTSEFFFFFSFKGDNVASKEVKITLNTGNQEK